jgi:hypothetical protein
MVLPEKIENLDKKRKPNPELVIIFGKLWEQLSTESWILPLTNDINYLKEIVCKTPEALNDEEKEIAIKYIAEVEKQVYWLYQEKDKIVTLFDSMRRNISSSNNITLINRVNELGQYIYPSSSDSIINLTTKMTNNMNIIIQNIRWCLWCTQKEINNHHNLAFWDSNKFFLAVYGEDTNKSLSDCIVDVFPYELSEWENAEEKREYQSFHEKENIEKIQIDQKKAFVIERIYGERNPDILLSIIQTIIKKQNESGIRDIDILVSNQALSSCHTNLHHIKELWKEENIEIKEIKSIVNIVRSPSEYWYYEFTDGGSWTIWWNFVTTWILISRTS